MQINPMVMNLKFRTFTDTPSWYCKHQGQPDQASSLQTQLRFFLEVQVIQQVRSTRWLTLSSTAAYSNLPHANHANRAVNAGAV